MNCPKCKGANYCKDGVVNQRQRYQCKGCRYRYTVVRKSDVRPYEIKRMALSMYLEGLGYRVIAKILEVNYVTVFYWIKEWGLHAKKLKSSVVLRAIEINQLRAVVKEKEKAKGYAMLLIDIKSGSSVLCWDDTPGMKAAVKKDKIKITVKGNDKAK